MGCFIKVILFNQNLLSMEQCLEVRHIHVRGDAGEGLGFEAFVVDVAWRALSAAGTFRAYRRKRRLYGLCNGLSLYYWIGTVLCPATGFAFESSPDGVELVDCSLN